MASGVSARDNGLLDHNLIELKDISNHAGSGLPVGEVCGLAGPKTAGLGRGIDGDKDDVSLVYVLINKHEKIERREKKVRTKDQRGEKKIDNIEERRK